MVCILGGILNFSVVRKEKLSGFRKVKDFLLEYNNTHDSYNWHLLQMAPLSISSVSGNVRSSNGRVGKIGFLPHHHEEKSADAELAELVTWFRGAAGDLI